MTIIRQEISFFAVPDFRNLGVAIRIFASAIILLLIMPLVNSIQPELNYWWQVTELAVWFCPAILMSVITLYSLNRLIHRLPFSVFWVWVVVMAIFCGMETYFYNYELFFRWHFWIISLYILVLLHYQALIQKALSPALTEARLSALTARIRPHFLFNSLNTAISLIRTRPHDAELVLENLSDLFREQLRETHPTSTLAREIELAQDYIAIESIRMGKERLKIEWNIKAPPDARTPHLFLQPLLENAVYHGIEPSHSPNGQIYVGITKRDNWIYIRIDNPLPQHNQHHKKGNKMALNNLSERLFLMYDQDATVRTSQQENLYRVNIRIPYYRKDLQPIKHY